MKKHLLVLFFIIAVVAVEKSDIVYWWYPSTDPTVTHYNVYALKPEELIGTNKWIPCWYVTTNEPIPHVKMEQIMPNRFYPRGLYKIVIRSSIGKVEGGDVNLTNDYYHQWDAELPSKPALTISP